MFANSKRITSSQNTIHERLREIVARHTSNAYQRPVAVARIEDCLPLLETIATENRPFIIDSGCGTADSSFLLAQRYPDHCILAIDKSAARLQAARKRHAKPSMMSNLILLRCDLIDFYLMAQKLKLRCAYHYLLYPNPWPKPEHLKRRWHAHPIFPTMLELGGFLELRSNWRIYIEEFAYALSCMGIRSNIDTVTPEIPFSAFERKYAASGHELYRCTAKLN